MRSLELFSGCGGLALGLSRVGFHHERMVEFDHDAVATLRHNQHRQIPYVGAWPVEHADVQSIDWHRHADPDLVAGGPPCQPFSIGGKHAGHSDVRDMWPEAIRAVRETMPRAFLFENVRNLAGPRFRPYLDWIITYLRHPEMERRDGEDHLTHTIRLKSADIESAYRVVVAKVNAADFGAAQKRHRVIIAGIRADLARDLSPPPSTHSRERLAWDQWVTGEYWKRHGLPRPADDRIPSIDQALVSTLRKSGLAPDTLPWVTVRDALTGLGDPNGENNHVFQDGARAYKGHTGSPLDQPAKALKAGDHGVPGGENMMIRDNGTVRYFTIREAARLQGLPDTYQFPGCWTESMRQLGNAVPVQLAESAGQWLAATLRTPFKVVRSAA